MTQRVHKGSGSREAQEYRDSRDVGFQGAQSLQTVNFTNSPNVLLPLPHWNSIDIKVLE